MKKFWRVAAWLGLIGLIVFGYCAYRTVWGTPFTLNLLANRQAIEFLIRNPETFSQVGIIDGTIFDRHSDKLAAVGVELVRVAVQEPQPKNTTLDSHHP